MVLCKTFFSELRYSARKKQMECCIFVVRLRLDTKLFGSENVVEQLVSFFVSVATTRTTWPDKRAISRPHSSLLAIARNAPGSSSTASSVMETMERPRCRRQVSSQASMWLGKAKEWDDGTGRPHNCNAKRLRTSSFDVRRRFVAVMVFQMAGETTAKRRDIRRLRWMRTPFQLEPVKYSNLTRLLRDCALRFSERSKIY